MKITMLSLWVIYVSAAFIGYFSFLDKTPEVVINRPVLPKKSDWMMKIARIAMMIKVFVSIPLNVNPGTT